jgi:HTH-type transcriptional regulator/antitoxin HigA
MFERGWFRGFVGNLKELKEQIEVVLGQFMELAGKSQAFLAFNRQRVRDGGTADQPALSAWRIRVISEALRETLPTYHPGIITPTFMRKVVKLSYLDDGPTQARKFLNENGIHLVIERHLPKTYLDGAAIRLPDGSPLVALTLRHDRLDNFWFTLCHELAHVALHLDGVDVIFDNLEEASEDVWEQEADAMASEALIPAKQWKAAKLTDDPSAVRVKAFAEKLRIHPAIPAGRVRYEAENYTILNDLIGNGCVRSMFEPETP